MARSLRSHAEHRKIYKDTHGLKMDAAGKLSWSEVSLGCAGISYFSLCFVFLLSLRPGKFLGY